MHGASGHMWWVARTSSALMVILPWLRHHNVARQRVTGVVLTQHDSLELRLFFPQLNEHKVVDLGQGWKWMRASPDGYLVFREEIVPYKRGVKSKEAIPMCYYLPRHPNDWAEDCEENSAYHGDSTAILRNPSTRLRHLEMGSNGSLAIELGELGEAAGATGVANQHSSSISVLRGVSPKLAGKARRWELIRTAVTAPSVSSW